MGLELRIFQLRELHVDAWRLAKGTQLTYVAYNSSFIGLRTPASEIWSHLIWYDIEARPPNVSPKSEIERFDRKTLTSKSCKRVRTVWQYSIFDLYTLLICEP